jgi:hypothetical protein
MPNKPKKKQRLLSTMATMPKQANIFQQVVLDYTMKLTDKANLYS